MKYAVYFKYDNKTRRKIFNDVARLVVEDGFLFIVNGRDEILAVYSQNSLVEVVVL